MGIKAALLDERGVYLRMDKVPNKAALTERHVPSITSCDLPGDRYLWIPDTRKRPDGSPINEYGGAFWELDWLQRVAATRRKAEGAARAVGEVYGSRNPELDLLVEFLRNRKLEKTR